MPNGFWNQSLPFTLNYGNPMSMFGGPQGSGFMGLGGLGMAKKPNPFTQGFVPNRNAPATPGNLNTPNPSQDPNPLNRPWLPWSGLQPGQTVFGGKTSMPEWTTSGPGAYWGIPTGTTEGTLATGTRVKPAWETEMEKNMIENAKRMGRWKEGMSVRVIS